jgi:hypothetical protein
MPWSSEREGEREKKEEEEEAKMKNRKQGALISEGRKFLMELALLITWQRIPTGVG